MNERWLAKMSRKERYGESSVNKWAHVKPSEPGQTIGYDNRQAM